ncbi:uncharacterized protein VDAG_05557 [Verticillium dahliae VdLs.17]|uniref:Clr5 domain-containing protein n=1 Tax=Verticillium dahliae (strain VdLs.17 / ATCC MYA-4575 / FGSC 10137) TaxID=498257 RepID=G2X5Q2_VERDV|nr:uncharacterized protein VDAG_05557 [Verticillium dahliae VdLs.17]EGY14393.1 hypothetical protein VDAG_05557 [Verticillium dahliae VdLs.17]KAH6700944.1 Clr5 domain-containing protein [Verticillium dahliae]
MMGKPWDKYQGEITKLYKDDRKTLDEVMIIMETKWQFKASKRAYRGRFKRWGIGKYTLTKNKNQKASAEKLESYQPESPPNPPFRFMAGQSITPTRSLSNNSGVERSRNFWEDAELSRQEIDELNCNRNTPLESFTRETQVETVCSVRHETLPPLSYTFPPSPASSASSFPEQVGVERDLTEEVPHNCLNRSTLTDISMDGMPLAHIQRMRQQSRRGPSQTYRATMNPGTPAYYSPLEDRNVDTQYSPEYQYTSGQGPHGQYSGRIPADFNSMEPSVAYLSGASCAIQQNNNANQTGWF